MEQDRRLLRAWRDYARQRCLKKASPPPITTSGRSTDDHINEMDAALALVGDGSYKKAMGVPLGVHCKGSEVALGNHVPTVALEAICT